MDYLQYLNKILNVVVKENASDIIISVGHPPMMRIAGQLVPLSKEKNINPDDSNGLAFCMMDESKKSKLLSDKETDFSYDFNGGNRFRVNVFFQRGSISLALRLISSNIKTIEDLSLPPIIHDFTNKSQGLVLVTGASGQGKSTTMAALINEINHTRPLHIITIEDPIEHVYKSDKAIIEQREISSDANSFAGALRASFRQNPDVIMVGEMRDLETISTAITAAETGHLVFATLHTNSAPQSVHRIVNAFPPEQQNQIRFQLAGSLLGVISQRLIPRISGGFVPACEVMLCNTAVSNLIRENKNHELSVVIETSSREGMVSFNRSLSDLVNKKEISLENSMKYSLDKVGLKSLLK